MSRAPSCMDEGFQPGNGILLLPEQMVMDKYTDGESQDVMCYGL